jgi:hypothetical protein
MILAYQLPVSLCFVGQAKPVIGFPSQDPTPSIAALWPPPHSLQQPACHSMSSV